MENDLFDPTENSAAPEKETTLQSSEEAETADFQGEETVKHSTEETPASEVSDGKAAEDKPHETNYLPFDVKPINPSSVFSQSTTSRRPKKRMAALAGLCLASAFIGGLTTVAALPHFYPNLSTMAPIAQTSSLQGISKSTAAIPVSNTSSNTQSPVEQIAKSVGPAVVGVSNYQSSQSFFGQGFGSGFGNSYGNGYGNNSRNNSGAGLQETGTGSGFIIDAQKGYIVTNNHVIDGAQKITVSLSDGRTVDAKLVGADPRTDLAVLQISDTKNLTAVTLGDSTKLQVGQSVVAIGNPGGNEFARSVTTGVISATNRSLDLQGEASFGLIQTDAAINPGNSGGPLVNYQGQVIGINSAKYAESGFEGMGFSIPISDALPTIQQLIQTGTAKHPALLVSVNDQYNTYAQQNNLPQGAYIADVSAGGPADKAGITKGDVITKINDASVQSSADLVRQLYKYNVGDKINVTFIRNGKTQVVQATLGEISSNQ